MAEVGPRAIRGNVAWITKRECELVANRILPLETQRVLRNVHDFLRQGHDVVRTVMAMVRLAQAPVSPEPHLQLTSSRSWDGLGLLG